MHSCELFSLLFLYIYDSFPFDLKYYQWNIYGVNLLIINYYVSGFIFLINFRCKILLNLEIFNTTSLKLKLFENIYLNQLKTCQRCTTIIFKKNYIKFKFIII